MTTVKKGDTVIVQGTTYTVQGIDYKAKDKRHVFWLDRGNDDEEVRLGELNRGGYRLKRWDTSGDAWDLVERTEVSPDEVALADDQEDEHDER